MTRMDQFTEQEKRMLAESVWRRQRSFIAGDVQFNSYGKLLDEILGTLDDYMPGRII